MDALTIIKDAIATVESSKAEAAKAVTPATLIRDIGLDSVATMEMVSIVEEQTGCTFDDEELVRVQSVGDLLALLAAKRG